MKKRVLFILLIISLCFNIVSIFIFTTSKGKIRHLNSKVEILGSRTSIVLDLLNSHSKIGLSLNNNFLKTYSADTVILKDIVGSTNKLIIHIPYNSCALCYEKLLTNISNHDINKDNIIIVFSGFEENRDLKSLIIKHGINNAYLGNIFRDGLSNNPVLFVTNEALTAQNIFIYDKILSDKMVNDYIKFITTKYFDTTS